MERVFSIVNRGLVILSIYREFASRDPICVSSNNSTEVHMAVFIAAHAIITQNNISELSVTIRNHDGYDRSTIIGQPDSHARRILQCIQIRFASI